MSVALFRLRSSEYISDGRLDEAEAKETLSYVEQVLGGDLRAFPYEGPES